MTHDELVQLMEQLGGKADNAQSKVDSVGDYVRRKANANVDAEVAGEAPSDPSDYREAIAAQLALQQYRDQQQAEMARANAKLRALQHPTQVEQEMAPRAQQVNPADDLRPSIANAEARGMPQGPSEDNVARARGAIAGYSHPLLAAGRGALRGAGSTILGFPGDLVELAGNIGQVGMDAAGLRKMEKFEGSPGTSAWLDQKMADDGPFTKSDYSTHDEAGAGLGATAALTLLGARGLRGVDKWANKPSSMWAMRGTEPVPMPVVPEQARTVPMPVVPAQARSVPMPTVGGSGRSGLTTQDRNLIGKDGPQFIEGGGPEGLYNSQRLQDILGEISGEMGTIGNTRKYKGRDRKRGDVIPPEYIEGGGPDGLYNPSDMWGSRMRAINDDIDSILAPTTPMRGTFVPKPPASKEVSSAPAWLQSEVARSGSRDQAEIMRHLNRQGGEMAPKITGAPLKPSQARVSEVDPQMDLTDLLSGESVFTRGAPSGSALDEHSAAALLRAFVKDAHRKAKTDPLKALQADMFGYRKPINPKNIVKRGGSPDQVSSLRRNRLEDDMPPTDYRRGGQVR